jgi:hypothetical protein
MTKQERTGKRDEYFKGWCAQKLSAEVFITEFSGSAQKEFSLFSRDKLPNSRAPTEEGGNKGWLTVSDIDFIFHNYRYHTLLMVEVKGWLGNRIDTEARSILDVSREHCNFEERSQHDILKYVHNAFEYFNGVNTKLYIGYCIVLFERRTFEDGRCYLRCLPAKGVTLNYSGDLEGFKTSDEVQKFFEDVLCQEYAKEVMIIRDVKIKPTKCGIILL